MQIWITRVGVVVAVVLVAVLVFRSGQRFADRITITAPSVAREDVAVLGSDGVQRITLSFGSSNYIPDIIRVRRGIPLEMAADMSRIGGCFSVVVIPGFGIRKQFTPSDNILRFTPDRAGTFNFSCPMGMGRGKIIVE